MFFDDRLATVLRHRADGEAAARTQFRQLLDLLGNRPHGSGSDESLLAAAWLRLSALGEILPSSDRARIVRETGWRFRNPELAAHLAEDEPEVASAAIGRADLIEEDWISLIPHLPIRARGFLRRRKALPIGAEGLLDQLGVADRGLPVPDSIKGGAQKETTDSVLLDSNTDPVSDRDTGPMARDAQTGAGLGPGNNNAKTKEGIERTALSPPIPPIKTSRASTNETEKSEIAELVERIAQFRKGRLPSAPASESSPRLPLEETLAPDGKRATSFSFAADASGRIDWTQQHVAEMVIGKRLIVARQIGADTSLDAAAHAFATHQPITGALLTLEGAPAIAGDWVVDAQPSFARNGGRFSGYLGRMRRPSSSATNGASQEADRVRQLLHELRTPVNALQGFAEIIQQQLFGPAPNEYRALAANIAADAARILAGFDELERLARLESGALTLSKGSSDISGIIQHMSAQLQSVLTPRMAGFSLKQADAGALLIAVDQDDAEAMIWRIMATLAGCCAASETLGLGVTQRSGQAAMHWDMPAQLQAEQKPFAADITLSYEGLSAGLFGAGFSLRLARAEARAAGGDLFIVDGRVSLFLPLLTEPHSRPSPASARQTAGGGRPAG